MAILQLKPSWEILNRPHDIKSQKLTYLVTMVLHLPLLFTMFLGRCFLIKHTCKKLEALNMFATLKIPRLGNLEGEWLIVHSPQGGFNLWDQWHFTLVLRLQICCWCDSPDKVVGSWNVGWGYLEQWQHTFSYPKASLHREIQPLHARNCARTSQNFLDLEESFRQICFIMVWWCVQRREMNISHLYSCI